MKVIHLISGGDSGGAKTHVLSLLRNLNQSITAQLVCFRDGPFADEARSMGIPTKIMGGNNVLKVRRELASYIRQEGYQIIHCHGARANMTGALLRKITGLPVVTTVHSDYKIDYMGRPLARCTFGVINTWALRRLDYRIGVSDAMVDLLISRGFPADRFFAIYNGIDFTPAPDQGDRIPYLRDLGVQMENDSVVVGIAARLNPVKDMSTLIRGFAEAYKSCDKLRLVIAGDGEEREKLGNLARELGVENRVTFAGWISGGMDRFYSALDINVLTSLSETFSYALTEGARFHLATISTAVGGIPYLIDQGVNGYLFQPGDWQTLGKRLAALGNDGTLRRELGERLYEKASTQFSIQRTVNTQLRIYEEILRRHSRPETGRDGVVICGAYGRGNAGDDAILEAIVTELRQLDPDLPLWVLSRRPDETRQTYRVNAIYTFAFPRFLWRMMKTRLYINGGGSLMQDVTSHRSLWFYLFTISAAKRLGNRVLMYGCGIGPIQSAANRKRASRVLQKSVDAITLRDTHSAAELEDMGVTHPKIILSADPTVILPPAPPQVIDGFMEQLGLEPKEKYIGFTLRPWPGFEEKAAIFGAAADYAYETYGLTPVFLPIEPRLDVGAARHALRHMKESTPRHLLEDTGGSDHTIGLLSRMQVVVSMRLHALVFAAGQGIPLVGVVYDQKISSFLSYIGQDLYTDLEQLTLPALTAQIDAACGRIGDTDFLAGGVTRLRQIEHRNQETAQALLGGLPS